MALSRDELRDLFHTLLQAQEETGAKMAANEYYTDAFHAGGPHNVGNDVLEAVRAMRQAGDGTLGDSRCDLRQLLTSLSTTKEQYAASCEDPDGYGSATFSEVIGALAVKMESRAPVVELPIAEAPRRRWWQLW